MFSVSQYYMHLTTGNATLHSPFLSSIISDNGDATEKVSKFCAFVWKGDTLNQGDTMDKRIISVLKAISSFLLAMAVVLAFFISGIRVFGFQVFGVLSGSMEPTYPTGSLIYVKPAEQNELRVNDIITFSLSPNVIATHRIVELVPDEANPSVVRYRTKGDANSVVDTDLVSYGSVIGKASFCVPLLGHFANYIQKPPGLYVALVVSVLLIGFVFLTDTLELQSRKKKKRKRRPADSPQRTVQRAAHADGQADDAQRPRRPQQEERYAAYDRQSYARPQQSYASSQKSQQNTYGQQGYAYGRSYAQPGQNQQSYANQRYSQQNQYGQQGYAHPQYGQQGQRQYSQQNNAGQQYGRQGQQEYPNWQRPQYIRPQEQQSGTPAQSAEQPYRRRTTQGYERQPGQDGQSGQQR